MASSVRPASGAAGMSALWAWDRVFDAVGSHGFALFPGYLLWSLPYILGGALLLDAAAGGDAAMLAPSAALLTAGGHLRWIGGFRMQGRLAGLLGRVLPDALRGSLPRYLWLRLWWNPMLAGPAALDPRSRTRPLAWLRRVKRRWGRGLFRFRLLGALFFLIVFLQMTLAQVFLTDVLLPSVLGVGWRWLAMIFASRLWILYSLFFCLVLAEFAVLVAGTAVYAALEERALGSDLFRRVSRLEEAAE